jgi:hypothetical protein
MEAIDGEAAVVSIKKLFRFNINGYQMPNKNGYEAATEIRAIETSSSYHSGNCGYFNRGKRKMF